MIIRLHSEERKRFVIIDKRAAEDARLSLRAKGLLLYLLSRPDNWNASPEHLAKHTTSDGIQCVRSALKELSATGYARLERLAGKRRGTYAGTRWTIMELATEIVPDRTSVTPKLGETLLNEEREERKTERKDRAAAPLLFPDFPDDPELQGRWEMFQVTRKQQGKPMTPNSRTLNLNRLRNAKNRDVQMAMLDAAIASDWRAVHPERERPKPGAPINVRNKRINALNERKAQLLRMDQTPKVRQELEQIRIQLTNL